MKLQGLLPEEMAAWAEGRGWPSYRGKQIFGWIHRRLALSFREMTDLPLEMREELSREEESLWHRFSILERREDPLEGVRKLLLELEDGETVEAVVMRHRYGWTACLSVQVGCRMGCVFCASTRGGLRRNLLAGEMVEELLTLERELRDRPLGVGPGWPEAPWRATGRREGEVGGGGEAKDSGTMRISRVVFMGMGEPLDNYDELLRAIRILHHPQGRNIGYRHFTVSTSGLVPGIRRLAEEGLPLGLAVSLHAPNDHVRQKLMPVAGRYAIREVLEAADRYAERTGRRVTYEYVLIEGVNDLAEHALELGRLLRGRLCHVNLIPWNPVEDTPEWLHGLAPEGAWRGRKVREPGSRAERASVSRFAVILRSMGLPVTVRRSLGRGIEAGCGQLRRVAARRSSSAVDPR